jgi:hypothetical protein
MKFFTEFSIDERKEILNLNYDFLKEYLFDWKAIFENFTSFLESKRKDLGLKGLDMIFTSSCKVKLCDSTCSINLIYTIDQLMKIEADSPDIIKMLERTKIACKLMKDITENANFARIETKNEKTILTFDSDRGSAYSLEEDYINYLLDGIKQYTQEPNTLKELKKIELKRMYGDKVDYILAGILFNAASKEIKEELEQFYDYIKEKIENVRKKIEKIFDDATSIRLLEERLENRLDITFDERDYTVNTDNF